MAKEIKTQILINASAHKVWEILTDFNAYGKWNPFIKSIEGDVAEGNRIKVTLAQANGNKMIFRPRVLQYTPVQTFRWIGRLWFKGLFDGEHGFELSDHDNGTTTFVQREVFKGLLVPFLSRMLDTDTRMSFERMNESLKQRSEE